MSGDPQTPSSDPERPGEIRQKVPTAATSALHPDEERRERSTAARFAGAGLQFAVTLLICLWLGTWLDRKFGTAPVFLYVGVFLGAGAAFYSMYRHLMANLERDEQAKRARARGRDDSPTSGGAP